MVARAALKRNKSRESRHRRSKRTRVPPRNRAINLPNYKFSFRKQDALPNAFTRTILVVGLERKGSSLNRLRIPKSEASDRRPAWIGRAYSNDHRDRVVRPSSKAVCRAQFGVDISTAINWVQRSTRPAASSRQIGGYPKRRRAASRSTGRTHRDDRRFRLPKDLPQRTAAGAAGRGTCVPRKIKIREKNAGDCHSFPVGH